MIEIRNSYRKKHQSGTSPNVNSIGVRMGDDLALIGLPGITSCLSILLTG
jgi:hypothetical protein